MERRGSWRTELLSGDDETFLETLRLIENLHDRLARAWLGDWHWPARVETQELNGIKLEKPSMQRVERLNWCQNQNRDQGR